MHSRNMWFSYCALIIDTLQPTPHQNTIEQERLFTMTITSITSSGTLSTHIPDVRLSWEITSLAAQRFAVLMKSTWSYAQHAYTPVEYNFVKAFPEALDHDASCAGYRHTYDQVKKSYNDEELKKSVIETLKRIFIFDPSAWPTSVVELYQHDKVIFVSAHINDQQVGFICFMIRPHYPQHHIKVMAFAVDPEHQQRGIGKLLMSSIFALEPTTQKIFLCTRINNHTARNAYTKWGFVNDTDPIMDHAFIKEYWIFMAYDTTHGHILQNVIKELKIS